MGQSAGVPGGASQPAAGGQFSFNFDDADVFSVIQTIFGDVLRVNYVVDPKVKGRVTFRSVAPVPKEDVLPLMEVILRLNGIAVVEESGLYRIIPLADLAREPSAVGFGRDSQKVILTGKALLPGHTHQLHGVHGNREAGYPLSFDECHSGRRAQDQPHHRRGYGRKREAHPVARGHIRQRAAEEEAATGLCLSRPEWEVKGHHRAASADIPRRAGSDTGSGQCDHRQAQRPRR